MSGRLKMQPCGKCGTDAALDVYSYEQSGGTRHVECDECHYLGPSAGSVRGAIKLHNDLMKSRKTEEPRNG